jgi:hypothetical protein
MRGPSGLRYLSLEGLIRIQISGTVKVLHIWEGGTRLEWRSALVNEVILRPRVVVTAFLRGTRPGCDIRVGICLGMPKEQSKSKVKNPWIQILHTVECSLLLGSP